MHDDFLQNSTIISYSASEFEQTSFVKLTDIDLTQSPQKGMIKWLNTYGLSYSSAFQALIHQNKLDDFLIKLLMDETHHSKVIELEGLLFIAIRVLKTEEANLDSELLIFIATHDFVWSIQEKPGDYFNWIRERLQLNKGIARKKKADYLLFLLLESIIDNYQNTYQKHFNLNSGSLNPSLLKSTPEFTALIESQKQALFNFKKAAISLRDTIVKLDKAEFWQIKTKYFSELKEQSNNLIAEIDFDLQELESNLNLIFSIQGHRLNEVMKTLTIFSVIFIPLTFLAGIYGMNFKNMPELESENGYFILLGLMLFITLVSILFFRRKNWF